MVGLWEREVEKRKGIKEWMKGSGVDIRLIDGYWFERRGRVVGREKERGMNEKDIEGSMLLLFLLYNTPFTAHVQIIMSQLYKTVYNGIHAGFKGIRQRWKGVFNITSLNVHILNTAYALIVTQTSHYHSVVEACTTSLEYNPRYTKALSRRAKAQHSLSNNQDALMGKKTNLYYNESNYNITMGLWAYVMLDEYGPSFVYADPSI